VSPPRHPAREQFDQVQRGMGEIAEHIRQLSHELHPAMLEHGGLLPALDSLALSVGLDVILTAPQTLPPLPPEIELCIFRATQEALHNIAKHAGVDRARLALSTDADAVFMRIEDAGRGFEVVPPHARRGLGLVSMEERVRLVGGTLTVRSQPGVGTTVLIRIPLLRDAPVAKAG